MVKGGPCMVKQEGGVKGLLVALDKCGFLQLRGLMCSYSEGTCYRTGCVVQGSLEPVTSRHFSVSACLSCANSACTVVRSLSCATDITGIQCWRGDKASACIRACCQMQVGIEVGVGVVWRSGSE